MSPTNLLNRSMKGGATLLGAVGLGAIAFLGMPEAAKAKGQDIPAGKEYFATPLGTTFYSTNWGTIPLKGIPIDEPNFGKTDTIVVRLKDCTFQGGSSVEECQVPIQIRELNLISADPVRIGNYTYNVIVGLDPQNQTQGSMTIKSDGTWSSSLPINSIAKFIALDGGPNIQEIVEKDVLTTQGTAQWSSTPTSDILPIARKNNFFPIGTVIEIPVVTPPTKQHGVILAPPTAKVGIPFNPQGTFLGPNVTINTPSGQQIVSPEPRHFVTPVEDFLGTLLKGTDFLYTPNDGSSSLPIDGIGIVPLKGNPDLLSRYYPADTVLQRKEDCTFVAGSCTVPLTIEYLNLISSQPVNIPGIGLSDLLISLDGVQDPGTITIQQSGTWAASLPVKAVAKLPDGTVLQTFSNTLNGNGTYTTVPEPSSAVPVALVGLAGMWVLRKKQSVK